MHLIRLEATNYRLHSRLIVDFEDLGSFTVTGPNGVGKSSLIEAVLYAFYGYHRSADTQGPAANRVVKSGQQACAVTLDFAVNGRVYRVVRKRRVVGRGSSELELYQLNDDGTKTALSEGADATQAKINRLVPAVSTLLSTNFVKQKDAARFPSARPAGRKAVLRSIFQIEEFRVVAKEARGKANGCEERAAVHERGAEGLEADEAALTDATLQVGQQRSAAAAARALLDTARQDLARAAEERARAEERAAQADRLRAEHAAQAQRVVELEREVQALRADVARLEAAADPAAVAEGQRHAEALPALLERLSAARAALVAASERCAEARGMDDAIARLQQRAESLAGRLAAPLPDLEGRTEAEIAAAAESLQAARAALADASRAADAHRAGARDLDRLLDRQRSAHRRLAEMPEPRSDLPALEARAAGIEQARAEVAALAAQVADLAAVRQRQASIAQHLVTLEGRLAALPPPPADLPKLQALHVALDERRAARTKAAAELDARQIADRKAQATLADARSSYAELNASLKAAEAAAGEASGAACARAGAWVVPGETVPVELFVVCPLSAAAARNRSALPDLRARVEAATTVGTQARQASMEAAGQVAEAREALATAETDLATAEAAARRLEEIRRADTAREEIQREIEMQRRFEASAQQAVTELGDVDVRHTAAAARQRDAEQALDALGRARADIETRRAAEADAAALDAEVSAATAQQNRTAPTLPAETEARAAVERAERAADLLSRFRAALQERQTLQSEADGVRSELESARARRAALGDPAAERADQERVVPELERAERESRLAIEAGQNADRAARDLVAARAQAEAAAARASAAATALAAMPTGEGGAEGVEAAKRAESAFRGAVEDQERAVAQSDRLTHSAEAQVQVLDARCQAKRAAREAAQAEQRDAAAWMRTAETCELAPTLIIEQSIAQLEAETNAVLEKISSRGLRLRLETQRALATGDEMAETLDILIDYDVGTLTYEDLSGGEQTRIDMALRVGLSRLLAGGQHVDFLILDEGWGDLDPEGVDTLREVVAGLQQLYANVILVTHKEVLFGMFGRRLHFEHSDEGSTMRLV